MPPHDPAGIHDAIHPKPQSKLQLLLLTAGAGVPDRTDASCADRELPVPSWSEVVRDCKVKPIREEFGGDGAH